MSDELGLQFVDTNVLVYAHDASAGKKHHIAKNLLLDLWESQKGCLSIQVLQEFYVTITKKVAAPVIPKTATVIITDLKQWKVHIPDVACILEAIDIQQQNDLSFWDSMIVCSASRLKCDLIWSEDLNAGQVYQTVKVVNPFKD